MAVAFSQSLGTGSATSAGTTTTISFAGGTKPAVGDCVLVACSRDNLVTDPATGDTCTDSNGNYYFRVQAVAGTTTTVAGGIVGVLFCSIISTVWSAGTNTITWTHPSVAARAVRADHFTGVGGYRITSNATAATTTGANVSVTTGTTAPVSGDLVYGLTAAEWGNNAAPTTVDTDVTSGSWSTTAFIGNGTASVAGVKVATQYKIVTAGGAQTFGPIGGFGGTTNVDVVGIVAAFLPTKAAASTFTDTFNTLDGAKWSTNQGTAPTIVAGQVRFITTTLYVELGSVANYTLINSSIYGQFFPEDSVNNTREFQLWLRLAGSASNALTAYHSNNDPSLPYMGFQYLIGGAATTTYLQPYVAATHRWWRIRESAGTVYWDTAPDGSTWTNRATVTLDVLTWQPDDLLVVISSGYSAVSETEPVYQYADNINSSADPTTPNTSNYRYKMAMQRAATW